MYCINFRCAYVITTFSGIPVASPDMAMSILAAIFQTEEAESRFTVFHGTPKCTAATKINENLQG